ncbi:MAG TPA: hypothetical protein OIM49_05895 [Clostridiaceae bacterium]|jgi:hypothetical protein|nr:hypothetical protein [Clostridiaceae bacterium]
MVIIGQEDKTIINFKRINFLNIEEADNNKFNILINYGNDMEGIIATYETEERAKEVLRDLLKSMKKQRFLMKPRISIEQQVIEAAKIYFERINGIDLIIDDNNFEIIPINKDNTIIYEMPEK